MKDKPPIFGMIQRTGEVVIPMREDVKQKTIGPLIQRTIVPGSVVDTNEYDLYHRLTFDPAHVIHGRLYPGASDPSRQGGHRRPV